MIRIERPPIEPNGETDEATRISGPVHHGVGSAFLPDARNGSTLQTDASVTIRPLILTPA
jgi:hypothetical protein